MADITIYNRIDEEKREISELVLSAKMGKWEKVWKLLGSSSMPKKIYLLNCIPEDRRWGVLHQAVFWKNPEILRKILSYPGCDPEMKAKECTSECGQTGRKNALEIAQAYGYTEVVSILQNNRVEATSNESQTIAPFDTVIERRGFGLIAITLAAFKATFHPNPIDTGRPIILILEDIFRYMNLSPNLWQKVRDQVCDTLEVVNPASSENIKSESTTRDKFYKTIINAYTRETTYLYDHVNTALRRQTENKYYPSAKDLAMGPYIVMYKILLMFWSKLPKENAPTYRKMLLKRSHLDQYQPGRRFTWHGFVSSSVELEKAIPFPTCDAEGEFNIVFTINNSCQSKWQPRNIEAFAQYHERERVYPAGARFHIMRRTQSGNMTNVLLNLIG